MIVSDIMTTKLITIAPNATLAHAANLLRQHQFHHLPVVRTMHLPESEQAEHGQRKTAQVLEGVIQDIDLAARVRGNASCAAARDALDGRRFGGADPRRAQPELPASGGIYSGRRR